MMIGQNIKVFLASGVTDLRKPINGLSILVENEMELDLFSGYLFDFCNRTTVKLLYWDRNGFYLWMKRLEKDKFQWPKSDAQSISISRREFSWLLTGLSIHQQKAHQELHYQFVS